MSKDKIEVNMNVYDIPILVEVLEEANKEIERLNELVKGLREERDYLFNKTTTESNYEIERLKRNGQRVATDYAIEKAKADMYMDIINEIKEMIEQYSYNAYYYKCDSQNKFFKSEIINDLKKILDKEDMK